jgi:putative peptidoglycan lipid II flippase
MARTASHALRLTLFVGIPAGVGIILVCDPLIRLMLNHGEFARSPDAVARTVWVASLFSLGIWAYSANHILIRAFYAMEQIQTPRRVAVAVAGFNFVCNMILVWPMAEGGLALSTVASAALQTAVLVRLLDRQCAHFQWRAIGASAARTLLATAVMGAAAWATIRWLVPLLSLEGRWLYVGQLVGGVTVGIGVFAATARLLRMSELGDLLRRSGAAEASPIEEVESPE